MRSKLELRRFYKKEILPNLNELEEKLQLAKKGGIYLIASFIITLGSFFIFKNTIIFLFGFATTLVLFYNFHNKSKGIDSEYMRLVIKPLIKGIDPSLKFIPTRGINQIIYEGSMLFPIDKSYSYTSNNLTLGTINNIDIKFGHINSQRSNDKHHRSIFHGLFIAAKMQKNINGTVCIYPDFAEKYFGFLGKSIQKNRRNNLQKVTLDSPIFEKEFTMDASYVLTHSMMERILELKRETKSTIYISFQNQNIYVAINSLDGFLQPFIIDLAEKKQVSTFQSIEKHVDALYLALNLAEDLKLEVTA